LEGCSYGQWAFLDAPNFPKGASITSIEIRLLESPLRHLQETGRKLGHHYKTLSLV